jgi:hypothetical protein
VDLGPRVSIRKHKLLHLLESLLEEQLPLVEHLQDLLI